MALFSVILSLKPLRRLLRKCWAQNRSGDGPKTIAAAWSGEGVSKVRGLQHELQQGCTECGACVRPCAFLTRHGTPKSIATTHDFANPADRALAYECSLCGLCTAVCPEQLDPCRLFLEIRRLHVAEGAFTVQPYRLLIGYERRGSSPLFSWRGLPPDCDTVFFPGCTLPGTRPAVTMAMYRQLGLLIPALGVVLDCCTKSSHDLGRTDHFHAAFAALTGNLTSHGVRKVVTACPNCTAMFRQYGGEIAVQTAYELLHANEKETEGTSERRGEVSVHDPCPLRDDQGVQAAVRGLLSGLGYTVVEMRHRRHKALCCGEGGAVPFVDPGLSERWAMRRAQEAENRLVVAYCSGCVNKLNQSTPTVHIADLLFRPEAVRSGKALAARPPFTYWNRLLLKYRLQRRLRCTPEPS
jgi:Fe-S oxidoreductase